MNFISGRQDRFRVLLTDYLDTLRERSLSEATVDNYGRDLNAFFDFCLTRDCNAPENIRAEHIIAYLERMSRAGKGTATLNRHLSAIRGFCRFMVAEKLCDKDISQNVAAPKNHRPLPDVLTEKEIEKLLELPDSSTPLGLRDRAVLELMYGCGLRVSEAAAVKVNDLDRESHLLRCFGKGSKERIVPIGSFAMEAVEDYLINARPILLRGKTSQELFLNRLGTGLSRSGLFRIIDGYGRELGYDIHPHTIRHCTATHMMAHGADIRIVQEFLGHSDISTTQIYTHVDLSQLNRVYAMHHPRAVKKGE